VCRFDVTCQEATFWYESLVLKQKCVRFVSVTPRDHDRHFGFVIEYRHADHVVRDRKPPPSEAHDATRQHKHNRKLVSILNYDTRPS
jgi:hypothetical protein